MEHLQHFALAHLHRHARHGTDNLDVAVLRQQAHHLGEQVVTCQDGDAIAEQGVGGGASAAHRRVVHHVVVDEGGGVHQLRRRRQRHEPTPVEEHARGVRAQADKGGAQPFPPRGEHMLSQRPDGAHRGRDLLLDAFLYRLQVG